MAKQKTNPAKQRVNIESLTNIGDKAKAMFDDKLDLNAANTAIRAYNGATSAARMQLVHKKFTGTPKKINFLAD